MTMLPDLPKALPVFRVYDLKTQRLWIIQATVITVFLIYTIFLSTLPSLSEILSPAVQASTSSFNGTTTHDDIPFTAPTLDYKNTSTKQWHFNFSRPVAVDVWFSLSIIPALDAITVVASCNRPIIDHWHYFVSVRMMAFASLASFIVLLMSSPMTQPFVSSHLGLVCTSALAIYGLIGLCLDRFRAPPPKRTTNLRNWSLSEYANALSRSNGTWRAAITSTAVTCGLGTVLTAVIPADWSTIIPVITTGFEYTVCAAPFFQGGVCVHWGLRQVLVSPSVVFPPWMFLSLLVASRLVLDLHLHTVFRDYPEFRWARSNAVISTTTLVQSTIMLLVLEAIQIPVMRWIKPITVLILYSTSIVGVSMPAAYNIAFERIARA